MVTEHEALHAIVQRCALNAGIGIIEWCEKNDVSYDAVRRKPRPSRESHYPHLATIYRVCNAAGIKPSRFFAALGK